MKKRLNGGRWLAFVRILQLLGRWWSVMKSRILRMRGGKDRNSHDDQRGEQPNEQICRCFHDYPPPNRQFKMQMENSAGLPHNFNLVTFYFDHKISELMRALE